MDGHSKMNKTLCVCECVCEREDEFECVCVKKSNCSAVKLEVQILKARVGEIVF